jgi:hypothetical protein
MAIPVKDDVKKILEPYHGKIRNVVEEAWTEWRAVQALRVDAGLPALLYQRTISNYIFDAIARRAIPAFGAESRVSVKIEAQTFKLSFRGVAARFKKGGDDGLGCSIPTQAALAFIEVEGLLPGLPPETAKIEIIWRPNEIWTQLAGVFVVARDGDRLLWEYEIEEAGESGVVVDMPTTLPKSPEPDGGDLVKPKPKPIDKPEER